MFYLLIGLLGCTGGELDSASVGDDTSEEVNPIHWDECSYRIGEHICDLTLPDSNMGEFNLYEHYGKPIVIQLAAEWCSPCHVAGSYAEQFMSQYAIEDLLWVTILLENDQGQVPTAGDLAEWTTEMGTTNSIVLAGSRDLIDPTAQNGFPLTSWPTLIVVDQDMVIFHGFSGWSEEYLNQKITDMLMQGR
jgi:thiol-disulfide isomerase/thioredoxin